MDLISAFAPGYYRLGGTRNDLMFFDEDSVAENIPKEDLKFENDVANCPLVHNESGKISAFSLTPLKEKY